MKNLQCSVLCENLSYVNVCVVSVRLYILLLTVCVGSSNYCMYVKIRNTLNILKWVDQCRDLYLYKFNLFSIHDCGQLNMLLEYSTQSINTFYNIGDSKANNMSL